MREHIKTVHFSSYCSADRLESGQDSTSRPTRLAPSTSSDSFLDEEVSGPSRLSHLDDECCLDEAVKVSGSSRLLFLDDDE